MHFLDDVSLIQAYVKKRQSNSDLEAIINCISLAIAPTTCIFAKAQQTSAAVERSFSMLSKPTEKRQKF